VAGLVEWDGLFAGPGWEQYTQYNQLPVFGSQLPARLIGHSHAQVTGSGDSGPKEGRPFSVFNYHIAAGRWPGAARLGSRLGAQLPTAANSRPLNRTKLISNEIRGSG